MDAVSLKGFKRDAKLQAAILGQEAPADQRSAAWFISDPTDAMFGTEVPEDIIEDENAAALLEDYGVVIFRESERFVARVEREGLEDWLAARRVRGADQRTLALPSTVGYRGAAASMTNASGLGSQANRMVDFATGVNAMQPEAKQPDWRFDGPRAAREFLELVRDGPQNLVSYHSEWIRLSGVHEGGAQAHEHRSLCETIRLAVCVDHLDCTNLACMEHVVRRSVALELAVERNPRHPDYSGLDIVEGGVVTSKGAVRMATFREHVSGRQKERANIMKQERMFREEAETRDKRTREQYGKDGGKGKDKGKKGRGKGGANDNTSGGGGDSFEAAAAA